MGLVKKVDVASFTKPKRKGRYKPQKEREFSPRALKLSSELYQQFNEFHSLDVYPDRVIETLKLQQQEHVVSQIGVYDVPREFVRFSPSSASACERELYFKAIKAQKDDRKMFPFQRRWVGNSTAIHERTQSDILYQAVVLDNPKYTVKMLENGLPAWEEAIKGWKQFEHNGETFIVNGMCDGVLIYTPENKEIGFEFKTKSNSKGQVGARSLKDAQDSHKAQCIGYNLLFDLDEFLIMYEAVAKDSWSSNEDAKPDIRVFHYDVTEAHRTALLDKFARVTKAVRTDTLPEGDFDKCLFCQYKKTCELLGGE